MSLRSIFQPVCCVVLGHAPIVDTDLRANKSQYVCERCRAVLGDFVSNLRKPDAAQLSDARHPTGG